MLFFVLGVAQVVCTALLAAGALRAGRRIPGSILVASTVLALGSALPLPEIVSTLAAALLFAGIGLIAASGLSRTTGAASLATRARLS